MNFTRRQFIKGLAAFSASTSFGISVASSQENDRRVAIEKAIKASFGGGFSLVSYAQSGGVTQAKIDNFGNQYTVTSLNLFDWKIIKSSLSN
jgi:hypothetical protein